MSEAPATPPMTDEQVYFLSEILKSPVLLQGKKIGKLADVVVTETAKVPEVTHVCVSRPFGDPALLVPWDKIRSLAPGEVVLDIDAVAAYQQLPPPEAVLLRDHILDKKILDLEDRDVAVVYDVRLVLRGGKLYVSDVDISRYGLLRRMGLKSVANFIYSLAFMTGARGLYSPRMKFLSDILYPLANKIKDTRISWTYIQPLPTQISSFKGDVKLRVLKDKLSEIPPVDLADILEELDHAQRVMLFGQLDPAHASDTLEEIDPSIQRALVSSLQKEKVVPLINEMTPAQGADILSVLPWSEATAILALLNEENARKIRAILQRQEEKILNYCTTKILKVSPDTTVAQAQEEYPRLAKDRAVIMYLYVVDAQDKLLGVIDLKELLQADDAATLKEVMTTQVVTLNPDSTLGDASEAFARYGFRAIPITNENDKIMGVLPYRDVMNLKHRFIE